MDFINFLIDNYNIPILTAFLLGALVSLSPCQLAANIAAVAYISKEIKTVKNTLLNGLFYILGRGVSYTVLAALIYFGLSSFQISNIFQGWGSKVLGPILIVIGLIMLRVIKINFCKSEEKLEKVKIWLSRKGFIGSFLLGALFALAFCPHSGVLFFGVLIPLTLKSTESFLLPLTFAFGAGLPVVVFSFLLAFSAQKVGQVFQMMRKVEKITRYGVAIIFIGAGAYYTQELIKLLISIN